MFTIPTREAMLEAARSTFPIGARVLYRPVMGWPEQEETVVRSAPWALGHGAIVVKVEGRTGGVSVDHLTLIGKAGK